MSESQAQIEKEIEKVKATLASLGRLRPGTLSKQTRARGDRYFQITFSQKGKARCEYVRPDYEPTIREEVQTYRQLRELVRQWIDLELELSRIRQVAHAAGRQETKPAETVRQPGARRAGPAGPPAPETGPEPPSEDSPH